MSHQIAVIGIGRFGESLCHELTQQGAEVLAIDTDKHAIKHVSSIVSQAVIADASEEQVIQELSLHQFNTVVIAFAHDIGLSLLTAISLKDAGVTHLWAKSQNALHSRTLEKIGVNKIIQPESWIAKKVAYQLLSKHLQDYIALDGELALYQLVACDRLIGQSINDLKLPAGIDCFAIKQGNHLSKSPSETAELHSGDTLILGGQQLALNQFIQRL